MLLAALIALVTTLAGTMLTYLYDRRATVGARLCAGAAIGTALVGFAGYAACAVVGKMNSVSLGVAVLVAALPLLLLRRPDLRLRVLADLKASVRLRFPFPRRRFAYLVIGGLTLAMLCDLFRGTMYVDPVLGGVWTNNHHNIGDLPWHVAVVQDFVRGDNFPPQHPEYAGARLTYPFLVDFVHAQYVQAGASLEGAALLQNILLGASLLGLFYRFAFLLTRRVFATLVAPLLVLFSGGAGFLEFFRDYIPGQSWLQLLQNLPHDYTRDDSVTLKWGNSLTVLLTTQRGLMLAIPFALIVATIWWEERGHGSERGLPSQAVSPVSGGGFAPTPLPPPPFRERGSSRLVAASAKGKGGIRLDSPSPGTGEGEGSQVCERGGWGRTAHHSVAHPLHRLACAGFLTGLLPLIHGHTYLTLLLVGAGLAIQDLLAAARTPSGFAPLGLAVRERVRAWLLYFGLALLLAVPQAWVLTQSSSVQAAHFVAFEPGWDHGDMPLIPFWLWNLGAFIPLLLIALVLRRAGRPLLGRRLVRFYLPFVVCFVVPNLVRLAPWIWDNMKMLFYWHLASSIVIAALLGRLWSLPRWSQFRPFSRAVALALLFLLTFAGALDVARIGQGTMRQETYDPEGIAFAQAVVAATPPHALFLHYPIYNHPLTLAGRRLLCGYDGHLWSHGIDFQARKADCVAMFAGAPNARELLARYGVDYVVIGPLERSNGYNLGVVANEAFFQQFPVVVRSGSWVLYQVKGSPAPAAPPSPR